MKKLLDFFYKYRTITTVIKLMAMSLLMLFSLKWPILVNVMLLVSIIFVLTEFEFDGFYILFFLVNFRFVFRNNLNGNIPYVTIVFLFYFVYSIIRFFIFTKERPKINWIVVSISIAYIVYVILSLIIRSFSFSLLSKHLVMILLINYIFLFREKIDYIKIIRYFVLGILVAFLIELITQYWFSENFITMDLAVSAFRESRHRGLAGDPNYYGMDLILAISSLCYLIILKKTKIIPALIAIFLLFICSYFTYSKSVFIGLLFMLFILILFSLINDVKKNYKQLLYILGVLLLSVFVMQFILNKDLIITFKRFSEKYNIPGGSGDSISGETADNITTGRWTLWKNHLKYVFSGVKEFLFGGGIGTHVPPVEAHNTYIQTIYELGFVGALILLTLFVVILKNIGFGKTLKSIKHWMNLLPFLCGALMLASVNYLAVTSLVYHLAIMFFLVDEKNAAKLEETDVIKNK